jgi:hypothetical protein
MLAHFIEGLVEVRKVNAQFLADLFSFELAFVWRQPRGVALGLPYRAGVV